MFMPSNAILLVIVAATIVCYFKKLRRLGLGFLSGAALLLLLLGNGPVACWLLGNLEERYPPLDVASSDPRIRKVVVLAGYAQRDPRLPTTSSANCASTFRLTEALRIIKKKSDHHVILSGQGDVPLLLKEILIALDVNPGDIEIENRSRNTYESALHLKPDLDGRPFFLVTSAGHMPRAMGVFNKAGLLPVAAPTHYMSLAQSQAAGWIPSVDHLRCSDLALHEYAALLWYRVQNRL